MLDYRKEQQSYYRIVSVVIFEHVLINHDSEFFSKIYDLLKDDGVFKDRNFGELPDWLKSKGYEIMILPMFFNLDKSIKDMRDDLHQKPQE
mgnify:CR=1 FL=1